MISNETLKKVLVPDRFRHTKVTGLSETSERVEGWGEESECERVEGKKRERERGKGGEEVWR